MDYNQMNYNLNCVRYLIVPESLVNMGDKLPSTSGELDVAGVGVFDSRQEAHTYALRLAKEKNIQMMCIPYTIKQWIHASIRVSILEEILAKLTEEINILKEQNANLLLEAKYRPGGEGALEAESSFLNAVQGLS